MRIHSFGNNGNYSKTGWLKESRLQMRSSHILRDVGLQCAKQIEDLKQISGGIINTGDEFIPLCDDRHAANKSSYLLLGYSFELLLKSGVVSIYEGLPKKLFDSDIQSKYSHKLIAMCEDLGIDLNPKERELLNALRNDLINSARYPVKANSTKEYCIISNQNTSRYNDDKLYKEYLSLYERIYDLIKKIDATSCNPKMSYFIGIDEDGYFIYRSGGMLPTMMIYKFSKQQEECNEDNKECLYQLLINNVQHNAYKYYIERDWCNAKHMLHKVSRKKESLSDISNL